MLKYTKRGICIGILAVIAVLAAAVCLMGRKPDGEKPPEVTAASEEKICFWGQQEMKMEFPKEGGSPAMSLVGRSVIPLMPETEAGIYEGTCSCVGGSCFFMVHSYCGDDATAYELQVFDGDRKEWNSAPVAVELLERGHIYDIFAASAQELVLLVLTLNEDREYESYEAVHMSREGEELKRVDLLPACLELDMVQQQVLPTDICVDCRGNYYMISFDGKGMAVLDGEGQTIATRDSSIRYKRVVPWMTASPDGGILIQSYNEENGMEWLWLDGTREKSVGTARGVAFDDRLIPRDNGLYYYITGEKKIYQGNGGTGALEYAFDLRVVPEEERGAAHDRVWNELITGGGPDLLYIEAEDLTALWEKGVLMDLRELISQETLDMIYPGLLDTGTIDGSLAGVSIYYNFRSLVTDRNIWPKEEWTVEEVVALLETGEYPHAVHRRWRYSGPDALMQILVYDDLEHSPFIDWEAGTCAFDSDLFVRLLKAVKQYQGDLYAEVEAPDEYLACFQELADRNCLAVEDTVTDRSGFVYIKQFLGERYNRPGIPGADGSRQVERAVSRMPLARRQDKEKTL